MKSFDFEAYDTNNIAVTLDYLEDAASRQSPHDEQNDGNSAQGITTTQLQFATIIGGKAGAGVIRVTPHAGIGTIIAQASDSATVSVDALDAVALPAGRSVLCSFVNRAEYCCPGSEFVLVAVPEDALKQAGAVPGKAAAIHASPHASLEIIASYVGSLLGRHMPPALARICASSLLSMLAYALRDVSGDAAGGTDGGRPDPREDLYQEILRDVDSHCHLQDFGAAPMAQRHKVGIRTIQKIFQQHGTTLTDYIARSRLQIAARALADPDNSKKISDIAFEAGFSDIATFNRLFRKRFGESPSSFRRAHATPRPRSADTPDN